MTTTIDRNESVLRSVLGVVGGGLVATTAAVFGVCGRLGRLAYRAARGAVRWQIATWRGSVPALGARPVSRVAARLAEVGPSQIEEMESALREMRGRA